MPVDDLTSCVHECIYIILHAPCSVYIYISEKCRLGKEKNVTRSLLPICTFSFFFSPVQDVGGIEPASSAALTPFSALYFQ